MVLGELLSSLWSSKEKEEKEEKPKQGSIDFPQGAKLLQYRQKKIQRLDNRSRMMTDPNGFSQIDTLQGQRALNRAAGQNMDSNLTLVEGFSGMLGPTDANKRNEEDLIDLRQSEDTFNRKLSNYATAHQTLMDKTHSFITSTDTSNPYANKNVRLADGEIGYVNARGTYKWYPSQQVFNETAGKNGCPAYYASVDVKSNNYNVPGSTINTSPELSVGTPMIAGQSCGSEGRNIYVTQMANSRDITPKLEGCYKTNSNDGMVFQKDLGDQVSVATCKTRASDLGYSTFSLRDDGTGCSRCYVGNNSENAKTAGIATREVTSYSLVQSPDANSSGLLRNGQIGVGKDIQMGEGAKTKAPIKCPTGYGTEVHDDNKCFAGWSAGFGEGQAKNSCSTAGGKWIPLDYSNHPYTCQMPDSTNMKTQFEASEGCLPEIGGAINSNTIVGTYGGNCQAKPSIKCPKGYSGPNANNECIAGWSSACGEGCAKSECAAANGEWIPLDYGTHPYTCRMSTTAPTPAPITPVVTPKTKPSCYIDPKNLVRGQPVYTGCGYTYVSESERNTQCGPGGTSKWIGDEYTKDCIDRGQNVYTGCGYTYASESARNAECKSGGGISKII